VIWDLIAGSCNRLPRYWHTLRLLAQGTVLIRADGIETLGPIISQGQHMNFERALSIALSRFAIMSELGL
jgi:hypothetical protein